MSEYSEPDNLPAPAEDTSVRAAADLERARRDAHALMEQLAEAEGAGTDLERRGPTDPLAAKSEMARLRSLALRKQDEVREAQERLKRELDRKMAEAQATLKPLQRMVDRLTEGVWTVQLYLGRDEEILTLAGGEPADADEPITVRQLVLAMDQECAVASEEGGIDAIDIEEFDGWLLADPAHVEQVIPEKKGVVALVPRFGGKSYDDPWKTTAVAKANEQTYFLIRNGERLYRTWTDFNVGKTLVPARDEFTTFFEEERTDWNTHERRKVPLEPGTMAWARAEEQSDARRRHYMRAALVLQGLLERTTVFHPLPADELGVGFLDERHYFADRVRIVMDAEPALTAAGHEPFRVWQRRLNAELRPGLRVVGNFRGTDFFVANDFREMRNPRPGHSRLHPSTAEYPPTGVPLAIEERANGRRWGEPDTDGLVVRYEREQETWIRNEWGDEEYRKPRTRASCTVYPQDPFLIPFDLATVEEMEYYLRSRTERHEYLTMFTVLKAAIAAKKREAEEEEPFRLMLAGVLARETGRAVVEAEEAVPDLVRWWKLANRHHRPLVGSEDENAKAVRAIVAEYRRRLKDAGRRSETDAGAAVRALLGRHAEALLVARKRAGNRYVVLIPERGAGEPDADVFCAEWEYTAQGALEGRPAKGSPRRWRLVGTRPEKGSWRVLWASDRWEAWDRGVSASEHLSDPEREDLARQIAGEPPKDRGSERGRLLAVTYVSHSRYFGIWRLVSGAETHETRPLTSRHSPPGISYRVRRWRRTTGGRVRLLAEEGAGGIPSWKGGRPPGVLLFEDAETLAQKAREERRYGEMEALRRRLEAEAFRALGAIEEAWLQNAEREAYRRFMEDYDDPERWEGHRKTLTISYPYRTTYREGGLDLLVKRLVEEGAPLSGLTVAEAAALAKELGIEHDLEPPDDLAGLRFPEAGEED